MLTFFALNSGIPTSCLLLDFSRCEIVFPHLCVSDNSSYLPQAENTCPKGSVFHGYIHASSANNKKKCLLSAKLKYGILSVYPQPPLFSSLCGRVSCANREKIFHHPLLLLHKTTQELFFGVLPINSRLFPNISESHCCDSLT